MIFQGVCQNQKELAGVCDQVIAKFTSLNFEITDSKKEHSLMLFMLVRIGYTLHAKSCTREIKNCKVLLDDVFTIDEILQDLHISCELEIMKSGRYIVAY
jgi:hypothetical protein